MLTAVCQFNVVGAAQKNGNERRRVLKDWRRSARITGVPAHGLCQALTIARKMISGRSLSFAHLSIPRSGLRRVSLPGNVLR